MLVKLSDQTVNVRIRHLTPEESLEYVKDTKALKDSSRVNRVTVCSVEDSVGQPLCIADSICVKPDQFVRRVGSRKVIVHAGELLNLSREDRATLHRVMFSGDKHGNPKKSVEPVSQCCSSETCSTPTV